VQSTMKVTWGHMPLLLALLFQSSFVKAYNWTECAR
jgi:hypothetical protein